MESNTPQNNAIIEFLTYCIGHRSFLIKGLIMIGLLSAGISLILPKEYQTSAVILPPGSSSSGLLSILPPNMAEGLSGAIGSAASGQGETNKAMAILRSESLARNTIQRFDLMDRYGAKVMEHAQQIFNDHVQFDFDEEGMIRTSVRTETGYFHWDEQETKARHLGKEMSDYILFQIDSIYTALSTQKASYERQMIERRLNQNRADIDSLQRRLEQFGAKYGIVDLTEQMKTAVQMAGELKTQMVKQQIQVGVMKELFNNETSDIREKELTIRKLEHELRDLINTSTQTDSLRILPSFRQAPQLQSQYTELQLEVAMQTELYKFLTQQYEQARIQETQNTPSLQILDQPVLATKRSAPRRSIFVILATGGGFFVLLLSLVLYDKWYLPYKPALQEAWQESQ
ncbi:MAG: GNVR domain-containing protein [Bacteroidota bacterium]